MSKFFKGSRESVLLPVTAECLTDGGGEHKVKFKARYRRPPHSEIKEIREQAQAGNLLDEELVKRLLVGWQDVVDNNDAPIEFSEETMADAMDTHGYREALIRGALIITFGRKETEALEAMRLKNLQKSAAPG